MDRVHAFAERPVDESQFVAVAIGESGVDQRHIGILHRRDGAAPELLHLAWHCRLKNDTELPAYLTIWVAPSALQERLRNVAALCRRVWRKNGSGGIPYAFSSPQESFDAGTGAFLIGSTRYGLTCASFVLAIFDAAGLRIAEYSSWPVNRDGDCKWQEKIIECLSDHAEQEHIDHLRGEIGAVRFRPEEVAAAAAIAPPPTSFDAAAELGSRILAKMLQITLTSEANNPPDAGDHR